MNEIYLLNIYQPFSNLYFPLVVIFYSIFFIRSSAFFFTVPFRLRATDSLPGVDYPFDLLILIASFNLIILSLLLPYYSSFIIIFRNFYCSLISFRIFYFNFWIFSVSKPMLIAKVFKHSSPELSIISLNRDWPSHSLVPKSKTRPSMFFSRRSCLRSMESYSSYSWYDSETFKLGGGQ